VTFDGIPYSDSFAVEMRWVARRKSQCDVLIDVGLQVDFKKSTMLKKQIKAGTISETGQIHLRLFEEARKACGAAEEVDVEEEKEQTWKATDAETGVLSQLQNALDMIPADTTTAFGAVAAAIVIVLVWRFLVFFFRTRQDASLSVDDIQYLGNRIDELQKEVKMVQVTLDQVLLLLKERKV
jgi:hypothetical protein